MNWRWLIMDYVPPELNLTRAERKRATRRMYAFRWRVRLVKWSLPASAVVGPVFCVHAGRWVAGLLLEAGLAHPWSKTLGTAAALITYVAALMFVLALLYVRPMRWALRDIGYDVCVKCGYWLRGLADDDPRCPECGARRQPPPKSET